jgi:hypothetical protein
MPQQDKQHCKTTAYSSYRHILSLVLGASIELAAIQCRCRFSQHHLGHPENSVHSRAALVYDYAMFKTFLSVVLLVPFVLCIPAMPQSHDSDRDGLTDHLEQELLVKFAPIFMLSTKECDGAPAEFHPDSQEPRLSSKNGTIYGQVFPAGVRGKSRSMAEIHYYHLWTQDCGLNGHPLDAEHVSVLISADNPGEPAASWKAEYWYAAAHEETACDASHAVRSSIIDAEQRGATIWISAGKHASFLSREWCSGGCGADKCAEMTVLTPAKLLNLGERGAPMNGSIWMKSPRWPLSAKMQTDFPESLITRLDVAEPSGILPANDSQASVKAIVLAGSSTMSALAAADQNTGAALTDTTDATGRSINEAKDGIGNSLKLTFRALLKTLGDSHEQGNAKIR